MRPHPALTPGRRAQVVPPLPHPSWTAASRRLPTTRRLSAGEFWDRLGF